jgi:hypothetical protein
MDMKIDIGVTLGMKLLFDAYDKVLPEGNKTKDFFAAFTQDIADYIAAAGSVGIPADALVGEGLRITVSLNPTNELEAVCVAVKEHVNGGGKQ